MKPKTDNDERILTKWKHNVAHR